MSIFETLNNINVNGHTEKKNGLTYLSWPWAWGEVKKAYPDATYTIYENAAGMFYHTDGRTAWVKTGVTIEGIEHIEYLPVMDFKNKSIPLDQLTSFDVNKAIQRSLTKACARHGLGLYIYAGEDLPESEQTPVERPIKDEAVEMGLSMKEEPPSDIPNVSDKTLRSEIIVIAEKLGYSEEQMTNHPYKKYDNKFFDSLSSADLRDLKKALSAKAKNASK